MEQVKINLSNSTIRNAKVLIGLVDHELLKNSRLGYGYGAIHYQDYGLKVDRDVLDYMREHYEKQGFKVEVNYPTNVIEGKEKIFTVRVI